MRKMFFMALCLMPLAVWSQDDVFVNREPAQRNVLLEEYTGVSCGNCPRGHALESQFFEQYPDRFFAINIHAGSYASPILDDPDMRTSDGDKLNSTFGISAYPAGVIQRRKFDGTYDQSTTYWSARIQEVMAEDAYANVAARGELDWATRKLSLRVQEYYTGEPKDGYVVNYLHVAMIQDGIIARQIDYGNYNPSQVTEDGKYRHLHVLRDFLTPVSVGELVTGVYEGAFLEQTLEYTLPEAITDIPLDLTKVHFIVFLTETQTKEVINVCQAEITDVNRPTSVLSLSNAVNAFSFSCDPSAKLAVEVEHIEGEAVNSLTFDIVSGAGLTQYTHTFDAPLTEGGKATVVTGEFPLVASNTDEEVTISISKVNAVAYTASSEITAVVKQNRAQNIGPMEVTMDIMQDRYGSDITWSVENPEGEKVYEGGPYSDLGGSGTKLNEVAMNLQDLCYAVRFNDKSADGINNEYGEGYIAFLAEGSEFYRHDGVYADSVVIMLDLRPNSANRSLSACTSLTYTRSGNLVTVSGEDIERIEVFGAEGRLWQRVNGNRVDLSSLSRGLYLLRVKTATGSATLKIVK